MNKWRIVPTAACAVLLGSAMLVPVAGRTAAASAVQAPAYGALAVTDYNSNVVEVFARSASGNAAPITSISGASTGLDRPTGIGFGGDGSLYVANYHNNRIIEFAPGANGDVAPARTITGAATGITSTSGLALTPDGKAVWLSDQRRSGTAVELEFATNANGDVAPVAKIRGARTSLKNVYGIAAEHDGTVTIDNNSMPYAVLSFGRHARGNSAPTRRISGPKTRLDVPTLIGLDAKGNIWVPNHGTSVGTT